MTLNYKKFSDFLIAVNVFAIVARLVLGLLIFQYDLFFYLPFFGITSHWMPFYPALVLAALGSGTFWVLSKEQPDNEFYQWAVIAFLLLMSINLFFNIP